MSKNDSVNPSSRGDNDQRDAQPGTQRDAHEDDAASTQGASRDHDRSSQHGKQAEQNHDLNSEYDPSNGKRHDQLRRNDKRGQMGG